MLAEHSGNGMLASPAAYALLPDTRHCNSGLLHPNCEKAKSNLKSPAHICSARTFASF